MRDSIGSPGNCEHKIKYVMSNDLIEHVPSSVLTHTQTISTLSTVPSEL